MARQRQTRSEEQRESDKDGEREKERGGELTLKQHNKETTLTAETQTPSFYVFE